jgi:DNA-binding response OmpR family regulator
LQKKGDTRFFYAPGNAHRQKPLAGRAFWGKCVAINHPANGRRILVAEDGYLLAEVLCDHLRDWGMEPIGPVARLEEACRLAEEGALDGALLDVRLGDSFSFPAAWILKTRGISFVFLTGYGSKTPIPPDLVEAPLIHKPFAADELKQAIGALVHGLSDRAHPARS